MKKPKLNYQNNKLKQQAIKEAQEESKLKHEVFDIYDWVEEFVDRAKDNYFSDKEFKGGTNDYIKYHARQFEDYVRQGKLSKEEYDEFVMLADLYADSDPEFTDSKKTRRKGNYLPKKPSDDLLYNFVRDPNANRFRFDDNAKKWYEEETYDDPEIVKQNKIIERNAKIAEAKLKQLLAKRKPKGNS